MVISNSDFINTTNCKLTKHTKNHLTKESHQQNVCKCQINQHATRGNTHKSYGLKNKFHNIARLKPTESATQTL